MLSALHDSKQLSDLKKASKIILRKVEEITSKLLVFFRLPNSKQGKKRITVVSNNVKST